MWKQKDEEEVKQIRRRKKNAYKGIRQPCFLALITFFVTAISIKIGFSKYALPEISPITWGAFLEYGLLNAFWIALFFLLCFIRYKLFRKILFFQRQRL